MRPFVAPTALAALALGAGCSLVTNLDDLGSDAGDGASDVSQLDAAPCIATPLIGTNDLSKVPTPDIVSAGGLDVFRFSAASAGVATCAWIYVRAAAPSVSSVFIATYDLDDAGEPRALIATGTLTAPSIGWNSARLDSPITLTAGETLWVGALSPTGDLPVADTDQGCAFPTREDKPLAFPPKTFLQMTTYPPCDMALYLGP